MNRLFVNVAGGDFAQHPRLINMFYFGSKFISYLIPVPAKRGLPSSVR
jgi:hypothetical protein